MLQRTSCMPRCVSTPVSNCRSRCRCTGSPPIRPLPVSGSRLSASFPLACRPEHAEVTSDGKFNGHMVLVVPHPGVFIDPTAQQFPEMRRTALRGCRVRAAAGWCAVRGSGPGSPP